MSKRRSNALVETGSVNRHFKVTIIGSGVVGYATGMGLREKGHSVLFHDINPKALERLQDLDLNTTDSLKTAADYGEVVMVCVPTPAKVGSLDLSILEKTVKALAAHTADSIVIVRSTVVVGTMRRLSQYLPLERLVYNPEFLRANHALEDFRHPSRIVLASPSVRARATGLSLYRDFTGPIVESESWEAAEAAKLVSNGFLASKISYFNEIWALCRALSVDYGMVARIVALDDRIGTYGTIGGHPYDGACLPKDSAALVDLAERAGRRLRILEASQQVNKEA